jgi:hypothetical protein
MTKGDFFRYVLASLALILWAILAAYCVIALFGGAI